MMTTMTKQSELHGDTARLDQLGKIRVVLVDTTHPGNIGASARAMKTMGLEQLVLVRPQGYPAGQATAMASGAHDLLASARVLEHMVDALDGCRLILGTSARGRSLALPRLDLREAAGLMLDEAPHGDVAVLFGQERIGLTNEQLARCHYRVEIPARPDFASLNLSQAVQLVAYELRMAAVASQRRLSTPPPEGVHTPAPSSELEGFFEHLEQTLHDIRFLHPAQPGRMLLRLRRLFQRARPDRKELNILRGILSAAQRAAGKTAAGDRGE